MSKSKPLPDRFDLPRLPALDHTHHARNDVIYSLNSGIIHSDQFTKKKLKTILHLITIELKTRGGTKTPHIFLPFRSKINDEKLELFLTKVYPNGELIDIESDESKAMRIVKSTDDFTLICALKYLWTRLPNNEIIGWDVYVEFKRREEEAGCPKNAFLTIMPKCLSSPAHASIVYDFLDLLISITSNSQYNYLSGRKITKMASIWAFNPMAKLTKSPFYDATIENEFNFSQGLESWKPSSNALFHLLLSFLRAMLPDSDTETLKLPKTLQSLLITNTYPPPDEDDALKSMITIPCVCIESTRPSSNPYELISKIRHSLSFDKKDSFHSMENYTILKNVFQKGSTKEIVETLTDESRRVLNRLTEEPIQSNYSLYPGWSRNVVNIDQDIPLFSQIAVNDVTIQDYYIWTWLSTLGSDQISQFKHLFGRSIVVEAQFKGFQKWIILTETTMNSKQYLNHFNLNVNDERNIPHKRVPSDESYKTKDMPLPPIPNELEEASGPLPSINFTDEDYKLDLGEFKVDDVADEEYQQYQEYLDFNDLGDDFEEKVQINKEASPPPQRNERRLKQSEERRRPPPLQNLKLRNNHELPLPPAPIQPQLPQSSNTQRDLPPTPPSERTDFYDNQLESQDPYRDYAYYEQQIEIRKPSIPIVPYDDPGVEGALESEQIERARQLQSPISEDRVNKAQEIDEAEAKALKEEKKKKKQEKEKKKQEKEAAKAMAAAAAAAAEAGYTSPTQFGFFPPGAIPPPPFFVQPPPSPTESTESGEKKRKKKKKKRSSRSLSPDKERIPRPEAQQQEQQQQQRPLSDPNQVDNYYEPPRQSSPGHNSSLPQIVEHPPNEPPPRNIYRGSSGYHNSTPNLAFEQEPNYSNQQDTNISSSSQTYITAPNNRSNASLPVPIQYKEPSSPPPRNPRRQSATPPHEQRSPMSRHSPGRLQSPDYQQRLRSPNGKSPNGRSPASPTRKRDDPTSLPPPPPQAIQPTPSPPASQQLEGYKDHNRIPVPTRPQIRSPPRPVNPNPNPLPTNDNEAYSNPAPASIPVEGYPPVQNYAPQSYPTQPSYPQAHPPQGYPHQGQVAPPAQGQPNPPTPQGYPPQSYPPQSHGYPPPPQGYPPQQTYPPPQGYPPQGYPPQGYPPPHTYPPQGYPPQGYPPQGYPPAPRPAPQGYPPNNYHTQPQYYPPPQAANYDTKGVPSGGQTRPANPQQQARNNAMMMGIPSAAKFNKNKGNNKASLRAAFIEGSFGI